MAGRPQRPSPADGLMAFNWACKLLAAFLGVCGVLIAGFAPYSVNMFEMLGIAGGLLLGAGAAMLLAGLLQRSRAGGAGGR